MIIDSEYHYETINVETQEKNLSSLLWWMKRVTIHFIYLGVAFFAPLRISFSVWFFQVIFAVYLMFGRSYLPGFDEQAVTAHRLGAFMAFPILIK